MHYIAKVKRTQNKIILTNVFNEDTDELAPNRRLTKHLRAQLKNIHKDAVVTFTSTSDTSDVNRVKVVG